MKKDTKNAGQGGFTLIELIAVIVILGILAVVAVPRFVDLREEAEEAALLGVAGAMASAMAINYAGCSAVDNTPTANKCIAVDNCNDVGSLLISGLPDGYTVGAGAISDNGVVVTCVVTQASSGNDENFQGIGAGQ